MERSGVVDYRYLDNHLKGTSQLQKNLPYFINDITGSEPTVKMLDT